MSYLADIFSYWNGNTTLTSILPFASLWTGLAPESKTFPYAVITSIALTPTFLTGAAHFSAFSFQITVFDSNPDTVETKLAGIAGQFDFKSIAASCMVCLRTNGPLLFVDSSTPERVYQGLLQYTLTANRTLPNT